MSRTCCIAFDPQTQCARREARLMHHSTARPCSCRVGSWRLVSKGLAEGTRTLEPCMAMLQAQTRSA